MSTGQHLEEIRRHREGWEYLVHRVMYDNMDAYAHTMSELGAAGWELVSAQPLSRGGSLRYEGGLTTALQMIYKRRLL